MAGSYGWSTMKNRQNSSVFHNLTSRPSFGSDVVQPYLINSSKGTFDNHHLLNFINIHRNKNVSPLFDITRAKKIETQVNSSNNNQTEQKKNITDKVYQHFYLIHEKYFSRDSRTSINTITMFFFI